MPATDVILLSSGGLRSLVAGLCTIAEFGHARIAILHIRDPRHNGLARQEHVRRQAAHLNIDRIMDLTLPRPAAGSETPAGPAGATASATASALPTLWRQRALLEALARAAELKARKVVWPVHCNGDFALAAAVTEQSLLLQQLARFERSDIAEVSTPLLELTDRQLIELGAQMDAPWHLAWSCLLANDRPCRTCEGCRRRRKAFDAAGIPDTEPAKPRV